MIYCIAMTFLADRNTKTLLILPEQFSFFCFAKAVCISENINYIFNEHGWQGSKQKIYSNIDMEKVDLRRLYYSYYLRRLSSHNCFFSFLLLE